MAPPGKQLDKYQRGSDYSRERYSRDSKSIFQNGHGRHPPSSQGQMMGPPGQGVVPYGSRQVVAQGYPPGQVAIPGTRSVFSEAVSNSPKAHQNANAILKYNKKLKGKVREGKHAATVDQMLENDLHNVEQVVQQPGDKNSRGGQANGGSFPPHNYLQRSLTLNSNDLAVHRPQRPEGEPDSELSMSFDPMKDRHMWTMWRTAVNGRIVDEVRRLEKIKTESPSTPDTTATTPGVYGRALVAPPLKRFIRIDNDSKEIAQQLSTLGQGRLQTSQFVYYGLPRVYVPTRRP